MNCHYCGNKPSAHHKASSRANGDYIYNGIDRVDNNKGYTLNNVVACCWNCNDGKGTKTKQEFLAWVTRIYNYQIRHTKTV